eukprot:11144905-Lingulodinium_polyedra.AAC.1
MRGPDPRSSGNGGAVPGSLGAWRGIPRRACRPPMGPSCRPCLPLPLLVGVGSSVAGRYRGAWPAVVGH